MGQGWGKSSRGLCPTACSVPASAQARLSATCLTEPRNEFPSKYRSTSLLLPY